MDIEECERKLNAAFRQGSAAMLLLWVHQYGRHLIAAAKERDALQAKFQRAKDLIVLVRERDALLKQVRNLRQFILSHSTYDDQGDHSWEGQCPVCIDCRKDTAEGHARDCELLRIIAETEPEEPPAEGGDAK